ncbi:MAG: type II toxin-antitoxin system RelE/ParE family toxin [Cyanobacteria bacterium J06621_8]
MYEIVLTRKAQKTYQQLNASVISRFNRCIEQLSQNPYQHPNIKSLKGKFKGRFRYRIGDYRVIYKIEEANKLVIILLIAVRSDVYR